MCLQSSGAFQSRPALSPATVYLLNSLEIRGDHAVVPKARSISQLSPKHHISPLLRSHQLNPQVSGVMLPMSLVPQAGCGVQLTPGTLRTGLAVASASAHSWGLCPVERAGSRVLTPALHPSPATTSAQRRCLHGSAEAFLIIQLVLFTHKPIWGIDMSWECKGNTEFSAQREMTLLWLRADGWGE